jgi:tRNA-binding protein
MSGAVPEDLERLDIRAFPPLRVGPFLSEVLTLGVYTEGETVVLVEPDCPVPNGSRLG